MREAHRYFGPGFASLYFLYFQQIHLLTPQAKSGLFVTADFIRPGEEPACRELDQALCVDLRPEGQLEHHLVDEIRRAMWRFRRCGEVELP